MREPRDSTFPAAIAMIAVHVLTDAVVHAGAATSPTLRLLGALVPIAVLVAAGLAHARVGRRSRALLALVLAPLALVGGGLAVADVVMAHLSVDTVTGVATTVAGLVLLVGGVRGLWRTRSTSGGLFLRATRRVGWAVVGVVATLVVIAPVGAAIGVTHLPHPSVGAPNLGPDVEEVEIVTADGLTLAAFYVPSSNGAAILVHPGRGGAAHARMLARRGYGVLIVDPRGQGDSEGEAHAVGWTAQLDVVAALSFLQHRDDVDPSRIGGLGLSVGGEALLQAAAETTALAAVVADGAGVRSVREVRLHTGVRRLVDVPVNALFTAATAVLSGVGPPPALQDLVPQISPRAVFFIHVKYGQGGEDLNPAYFEAAAEPKQIWRIDDARHTGGRSTHPDEYERRVVGFFDAALHP